MINLTPYSEGLRLGREDRRNNRPNVITIDRKENGKIKNRNYDYTTREFENGYRRGFAGKP